MNFSDINICFKYVKYLNGKNKFVFIGDSRIRQIFKSFITEFDPHFRYNDYKHFKKNGNLNKTEYSKKSSILKELSFEYSNELNTDYDEVNYFYSNSKLNLFIVR